MVVLFLTAYFISSVFLILLFFFFVFFFFLCMFRAGSYSPISLTFSFSISFTLLYSLSTRELKRVSDIIRIYVLLFVYQTEFFDRKKRGKKRFMPNHMTSVRVKQNKKIKNVRRKFGDEAIHAFKNIVIIKWEFNVNEKKTKTVLL